MWLRTLACLCALVLAGCAAPSEPAATSALDGTVASQSPTAVARATNAAIRFSGEAFTGELAGKVAFATPPDGPFRIDLTSIVPADAPVALTVTLDGYGYATLEMAQAGSNGVTRDTNGLSALVTRAPEGTVTLVLSSRSFMGAAGQTSHDVHYVAATVVRPEILPAGLPATVELVAGDVLQVRGDGVTSVVVIAPDGTYVRDESQPFEHNATLPGAHTLVALGAGDATLHGPNVTYGARRTQWVAGDTVPLGADGAQWTATPQGLPLQVRIHVQSDDGAVMATRGEIELEVAGPTGATILEYSGTCLPVPGAPCSAVFPVFGGSTGLSVISPFLGDGFAKGDYTATLQTSSSGHHAWMAWLEIVA